LRSITITRGLIVWLANLCLILIAFFLVPHFATFENLRNIFIRLLIIYLAALAQSFALVVGGFDLSLGANMSLATAIGSYILIVNPFLGFLGILSAGAVIGAANGLGITKLRLNPFVMTFGMLFIAQGFTLVLRPEHGGIIPRFLNEMLYQTYFGVPVFAIACVVLLLIASSILIQRTKIGRYLLAVGSNERAARDFGINVDRIRLLAFILCGATASLAGFFLGVRAGCGAAYIGEPFLMYSIGAAVAGGTSLTGGVTSPIGVLGGAVLFTLIDDILWLTNISGYYSLVVQGIILAIVIGLSEVIRR